MTSASRYAGGLRHDDMADQYEKMNSDAFIVSNRLRAERAERAVANFNRMTGPLTNLARALTKMPTVVVKAGRSTCTDGKTIFIKPPLELGDSLEHDRKLCDKMDAYGQLRCPACRASSSVLQGVYHELAHLAYESFAKVSDAAAKAGLEKAIEDYAISRSGKAAELLDRYMERVKAEGNYMSAAQIVSPYLPFLINALEDARVNERLHEDRPGTRPMFHRATRKILEDGAAMEDGTHFHWSDADPNSQAAIAVLCMASGYDPTGSLSEDVQCVIDDSELMDLAQRAASARSAEEVFHLGLVVIEKLRQHGFMRVDQDLFDELDEILVDPGPGDEEQDQGGDATSSDPTEGGKGRGKSDKSDGGDEDGEDSSSSGSGDQEAEDGDEDGAGASDSDEDADEDADGDSDGSSGAEDGEDDGSGAGDDSDDCAGDDESDDAGSGAGAGDGNSDGGGEGSDSSTDGGNESGEDDGEDDGEKGRYNTGTGDGAYRPGSSDMGSPDDVRRMLERFTGHKVDENGSKGDDHADEETDPDVDRALVQSEVFDEPTSGLFGIYVHTRPHEHGYPAVKSVWNDDTMDYEYVETSTWVDRTALTAWDPDEKSPWAGVWTVGFSEEKGIDEFPLDQSIITPALTRARIVFSDNKRTRHERNLRRGPKVNGSALSRVAFNDDRIFKRKLVPAKKDYFVLLGLDNSGSTRGTNLNVAKHSALHMAELLHRLGVRFALYAHNGLPHYFGTGRPNSDGYGSGALYDLDIAVIKPPQETWGPASIKRLKSLVPGGNNLDGHALEFYRKVAEKEQTTDKIIMYYTDGEMPNENYNDELHVLQREIDLIRRRQMTLLGVGVNTDSPRRHGLDTIKIRSIEDTPTIVRELERRLTGKGE